MSGIRKFRRSQASHLKREKASRKFLLRDFLLVAGILIAILGAFHGVRDYGIYLGGRPERINNSKLGTSYVPAIAPGDPGRRASAFAGLAAAVVGAAVAVFALAMRVIAKRRDSRGRGDVSRSPCGDGSLTGDS
jgi:hypothetical protein